VAFGHQGKTITRASEDGSIRIWDTNSGEGVSVLREPKPYEGLDITAVSGITEAQKTTLRLLGGSRQRTEVQGYNDSVAPSRLASVGE
jgi:WD40 repeat protein